MIVSPPGLSTPRLWLRSLQSEDLDGPYPSWFHDREISQYLETRFSPPDRDGCRRFVDDMNKSQSNLLLGMFIRPNGPHIGNIRLGPIDRHHGRAPIGILVGDRASWGQGYAAEAIQAISGHAFAELGLAKLTAGIYAPNRGSVRAFEKSGFGVDGVRRLHAVLDDGQRVDVIEMARFREAVT